jgi:hypothetical protein
MDKLKSHQLISVDSETGVYWDGQRVLTTQSQINAVIRPARVERLHRDDRVARVQTFIQLSAMKIIRTTAEIFEINTFRHM